MWDYSTAAEELLRGAYDLHVHSLPSVFAREQDGMEIIREAGKAGMAGVLLKSHYEPTALRAELINRYSAECLRSGRSGKSRSENHLDADQRCGQQPGVWKYGRGFLQKVGNKRDGRK